MLRKVRIIPKAQSGLEVKMRAGLGFNANQLSWPVMAGEFSEPDLEERQTLGPVPINQANLEAEVGETAVTDLTGDGIPEHYKIGGKRHYDGGTPLNLPDNSFIFSRDKTMKIRDPEILEQFDIKNAPPSGITPAEIAKKYNVNKYKKILLDKDSDDLAKKTAEMMIANFNLKLGKLALLQESLKGFPDGIPFITAPYLESIGLDPMEILMPKQTQAQPEQPDADVEPEMRYGGNYFQDGGGKNQKPRWRAIKHKGQYYWVLINPDNTIAVDPDTGKQIWQHDNDNPNPNDKRTAEEVFKINYPPGGGKKPAAASAKSKSAAPAAQKQNLIKPPLAGPNTSTDWDPRLSDNMDLYFKLVNKIKGDTKIQDAIYDKYRARIEASKKLTRDQKDKLLNIKKEDVIDNLLNFQKQVYAINAYDTANNGAIYNDPMWDKTSGGLKNKKYKQTLKELDFRDDEIFDDDQIMTAQAAYQGLVDVAESPDYQETFKDYTWSARGPKQTGTDYETVSDIDSIFGNNTVQQQFIARNPTQSEEQKETEETEEEGANVLEPNAVQKEYQYDMNTPFWLQDIIKTSGSLADMARIKRYMPWQAEPNVDYLDPSFVSPERELAANAEQLAIGAQGAAQFTGPQAYNARFSQLSGKAAANTADIMARYNNINVGIANEAEKFNVQTFNQYAQTKAANATNLYDKVTIANQQYDNAKNQARQQLRQSYIDAITNRAQTDVLNTLYPQYAVNPLTGGTAIFRDPKQLTGAKPVDELEGLNNWMERMPGYYANSKDGPRQWAEVYWDMIGIGSKRSKGDDEKEKTNPYGSPNPGYPPQ